MLILAAVVFLAALPFLVVGLVLIFVVLPIVSGGAWHAGRRWRGRTWRW
jgi:hypothetical protein